MIPCPCQSGLMFTACCGPYLAGAPAPTALALMRARYTAYTRGDGTYLLRSWASETRGGFDPAAMATETPQTEWLGLEIIDTVAGGAGDDTGIVEFAARFRQQGAPGMLRERSRFRRDAESGWVYVDGEIAMQPVKKVGRNDPCPCGSGKKFKACCGKA